VDPTRLGDGWNRRPGPICDLDGQLTRQRLDFLAQGTGHRLVGSEIHSLTLCLASARTTIFTIAAMDPWREGFAQALEAARKGLHEDSVRQLEALPPGSSRKERANRAVVLAVERSYLPWEAATRAVEDELLAVITDAPSQRLVLLAHYALARLFSAFGEIGAAIDHLQTAMAIDEAFLDVRARLEELQLQRAPEWVAVEAWLLLADQ
jgi:hypothetical protein